jgi:hypothetical protein
MSKKALIVMIAAAFALTAIGVMAQDNGGPGPGVINVTLPDGRSVPVFTDGRLNAFDIAAPVVVYYTAANGSIVNPNYTSGGQPDLTNLNFSDPNTMNAINGFMNGSNNNANASGTNNNANSANNNSNASGNNANNANNAANNNNAANSANGNGANNANSTTNQANQAGLINQLEVLAVGAGGSTGLVLNASVEDLLSLVTGQQSSLSAQGYSVNYDPKANYFWVQAPADFEGKVYTFAWPNNLFPTSLIGQNLHLTTTNLNANTSNNANANSSNANTNAGSSTQATAQPTSSSGGQATAQPTARPTTQPTSAPAQPTATP